MNRMLQSFKDKRFRYGSFSTVMVIVAVALFMLVNVVAGQLNVTRDLTREQLFSLSQGSIDIAQGLEADVRIYSLWPTGQEHFMFQRLLEEYATHSHRIAVSNRDPVLHPQFVEQFAQPDEPIAAGSIIVVGPNRHRVVHAADLTTTQFDFNTWQNRLISFDIEPQVTNAINFVVAEDTPVIYRVTGNNEFDLPSAFIQEIEMAGYEIREVNLLANEVPEDADMLLITLPERDWSEEQANRIEDYLRNDGRAMFILGYRPARFPRMDGVLASFGIAAGEYVVIEGNPNYIHSNNPLMLLPDFVSSEITDPLIERAFTPFLVQATPIKTLDLRRTTTRIEPLVRTSNQAYGRSDPEAVAVTRVPQDIDGPFNLAVTVEDTFLMVATNQNFTTRMVVIGAELILDERYNSAWGGANWNFVINSFNWLREEPARVFIPSQSPPAAMPLAMTQGEALRIVAISVIVLPLAFGIIGLVVWLRRRNA
ncbi:MAG: GldG family protein [Defluviitaleaceae bacterium]|nr:GldG family protein [Defluviitaleaceae bacterium]